MTLKELFAKTMQLHWSQDRYRSSGWADEVQRYWVSRIEPELGDEPITLRPSRIREFHLSFADTPNAGNRCLEVLSKMLTFAEEMEFIPVGSNPCRLVRSFPEKKRTRFATPEEIKRIGQAMRSRPKSEQREVAFVLLLLFTGMRPSALMRAKKSELRTHPDGFGILIGDGKATASTGDRDTTIIPDQAMREIVDRLPQRGDGLLIGLVHYRRFWEVIRKQAGCPDLWLRDMRRTFATIGLSNGVDIGVIGEMLNHRSIQTTKTYAKLLPTARVSAANTVGVQISGYLAVSV